MASEQTAKIIEISQPTKYKTTVVNKEIEPNIDLGNLLLDDLQPVDSTLLKLSADKYLQNLARENTQLLFAKIWQLPFENIDNIVAVELPEPTTNLPREKKIPKPKPPTRWEEYAKKKGIQNKKRGRMLWDEDLKSWKPRYGYKRANDETQQWCIEVPDHKDPYEDQFEKISSEKKERVAKNELKRLRNIAKHQKTDNKGIISTQLKPASTKEKDKDRVSKEIEVAKSSTASLGKFQDKLPNEIIKKSGKKRKFKTVCGNIENERLMSLDIFNKMNRASPMDITKAVNKKISQDQNQKSKVKKTSKKVKNKRFRKGVMDKMKFKTLGSKRR